MEDNLSVKEKELNVKLQETLKEKEKLEKMLETTVNELEWKENQRNQWSYYNKIVEITLNKKHSTKIQKILMSQLTDIHTKIKGGGY